MTDQFNLIDAISIINKRSNEKLRYDVTYKGYVSGISSSNSFNVVINGKEFTSVKSLSNNVQKGDVVWVMFPQNNPSQCFILSASNTSGTTPTPSDNAVLYTPQTLSAAEQQQARTNIGAGTSSFDGDYNNLSNQPSIPTKTSEITNDSGYITMSSVPAATTTTPKMDGVANVGNETKWAKGDHVHPSDDNKLNTDGGVAKNLTIDTSVKLTNGEDSCEIALDKGGSTLYVANYATADGNTIIRSVADPVETYDAVNLNYFNNHIPSDTPIPSNILPKKDFGSGSIGTSTTYARGDHVHPVDTSRLAKNGGEASNLLIVDYYTMVDQNDNKVDVIQKDGAIQFESNATSSDVVLKNIGDPVDEYDAVNLKTLGATADEINTVAQDALTAAQDAQSNASSALTEAQSKAPKAHASTATTYGAGTSSNYGHVKLSASTSSTSGVSGGTAATPSAVKSAYDLANKAVTTLLGGKKIVCGWNDVGYKSTGQTNTTINFGTTFTAKPIVIIGQPFNGVICTAFYDSVTTTGFTVNVPSVGSTTLSYRKMSWIAIGNVQ